jgi:hypothetical protein
MLRNVICTGRIMLCLLLLNGPFTSKTGQRRRSHARLAEDPFSSKPVDLRPRYHAHLHACRSTSATRVSGLSLRELNLISRNAAQISNKS